MLMMNKEKKNEEKEEPKISAEFAVNFEKPESRKWEDKDPLLKQLVANSYLRDIIKLKK